MCLKPVGQVVKAALVADFAFRQSSGQVLNLVRHFVPYAVEEFIGGRISGSFDQMVVNDERVQFDHFVVIMYHRDSQLSRNSGGEWSDIGKEGAFRHLDGNVVVILVAGRSLKYRCFVSLLMLL